MARFAARGAIGYRFIAQAPQQKPRVIRRAAGAKASFFCESCGSSVMQLSTKGRYAVMAMVDLARAAGEKPEPLHRVALRQSISLPYLEQLFLRLRRAGLVKSSRGASGGYELARSASNITIAEIMNAAEEPLRTTRCPDEDHGCCEGARCATHDLWHALGAHILQFLENATLEDAAVGRFAPSDEKGMAAE
jgi:Rrf2 family iron-sulfur cluster assembly transcriptional regulator